MRTTIRITLLQNRLGFALLLVGAAIVLASALGGYIWFTLTDVGICFHPPVDSSTWTEAQGLAFQARCEIASAIVSPLAFVVAGGANAVPLFAGMFLAAPLIAGEIEHSTATLSWTLARSRRAWFVPRAAIVLAATVGSALVLGLMLDWLVGALEPSINPWVSFYGYIGRGLMLPARALVVVAVGLFTGALLGRQVPALLFGFVLAGGLCLGLVNVDMQINRANSYRYAGSGLDIDQVMVDSSGKDVTWEEAVARIPVEDPRFDEAFGWVTIGLPDSEAPGVMARNVVLHAGVAAVLLLATMGIVSRRRPY